MVLVDLDDHRRRRAVLAEQAQRAHPARLEPPSEVTVLLRSDQADLVAAALRVAASHPEMSPEDRVDAAALADALASQLARYREPAQ